VNRSQLRSKRVLIPAIATVAVLGVGGVGGAVWGASADDNLTGADRDRVGRAAVDAVGGGTAVDVETSDDPGEAYEVEVRGQDGAETDVALDENLDVVRQQIDSADDAGRDDADDRDEADERDDADDRVLSAGERDRAAQAAVAAVGGGSAIEVEASDDRGEAYEVEVRAADGTEWDVELDAGFRVLRKHVSD
jgi:uncharacterized membrane protein YkoI